MLRNGESGGGEKYPKKKKIHISILMNKKMSTGTVLEVVVIDTEIYEPISDFRFPYTALFE